MDDAPVPRTPSDMCTARRVLPPLIHSATRAVRHVSFIAVALVWSDASAPPDALAEAVSAFLIAVLSFAGSHGAYKAFKAASDGCDGPKAV